MKLLSLLLLALPLLALDGTVINGTTDRPVPGATVNLFRFGDAGMEHAGAVTADAEGRFRFESAPAGPQMLQVVHQGVTYNQMVRPEATQEVRLAVYNVSPRSTEARVVQHMVLLEPDEGRLIIHESVIYRNDSRITYNDPANGTFRFYLPKETGGQVRVAAHSPGGIVPIQRVAEPTSAPNIYAVDFPVKPGETRFDLTYQVPMPDPPVFYSRTVHGGGPLRLVAPYGVRFKGDNLDDLGPEPRTQATIYHVHGSEYRVEIEGEGSLRGPQPSEPDEDEGARVRQSLPRLYQRLYIVLGLGLAILALGFALLYRRSEIKATRK